jgi:uncharacterized membrane protein YdbT with pleckstrin-like domain
MPASNKKAVSFFKALLSVFSAALGVQKRENMERDLNASNPKVYVIGALIFVTLFISSILAVVNWVMPS